MYQKPKIPQPLPVADRRKLYALWGGTPRYEYYTCKLIWLTKKQKTFFTLKHSAKLSEVLETDTIELYKYLPSNQIFDDMGGKYRNFVWENYLYG